MIPFSPPYIDSDVINEVTDSLQSGWITTGPKVRALELAIASISGVDQVLCVNSWTSGAILVLKWWGISPGDEVIIPAYTYSATALSIIQVGAIPVMVDVKDDFTIDEKALNAVISQKTKAILAVDFGGLLCDYDKIYDVILKPHVISKFTPSNSYQKQLGRILVISDAAHSIGASYNGKPSGSAVDITIFSLHAVKNITTAEGGAICINMPKSFDNSAIYSEMKLWSLNGQTKDAYSKSQAGGWRYDILFPGLKVNMPDVCAAIGLAQIRKYDSFLIKERERVAKAYNSFFSKFEQFELPPLEDVNRKSCFHLYALRIKNCSEKQRDLIIDEITQKRVAVNVHFIPMPMLTVFINLGYKIEDYPVAYNNYSREISLPIYPQLTNEQIDYICESVLDSYKKVVLND